ncbi:MAG: TerC family protein [Bacteroidetes bacterium]|nr:TerC family protein [Bacteroidota bacterium]MBK9671552.1 TerC family protein [Bacteroidota bacterium]MBK9799478.1 TerC family protein [Bacteroidota bacterium]MBP6413724.1 TerC family protein [Bacteroidia bacterium]
MIDVNELLTLNGLISLITLSFLEIILGIDNIIFISIVSSKLKKSEQGKARAWGLSLALIFRIALLFSISWIIGLKNPFLTIGSFGITGKDIILFAGGLFLIIKTILEIVEKINSTHHKDKEIASLTLKSAIVQIVFLDIIFSFDSILTAVGLVRNVLLMVMAVIIAMIAMLVFSEKVSEFINRHPTVKMLALAFLVMIGIVLVAEGLHFHVDKSFVYVALVFSLGVELLNMAYRSKAHRRTTE